MAGTSLTISVGRTPKLHFPLTSFSRKSSDPRDEKRMLLIKKTGLAAVRLEEGNRIFRLPLTKSWNFHTDHYGEFPSNPL